MTTLELAQEFQHTIMDLANELDRIRNGVIPTDKENACWLKLGDLVGRLVEKGLQNDGTSLA